MNAKQAKNELNVTTYEAPEVIVEGINLYNREKLELKLENTALVKGIRTISQKYDKPRGTTNI